MSSPKEEITHRQQNFSTIIAPHYHINEPDENYITDSAQETVKNPKELAVKLCDQINDLHALNCFFYIMIERLLNDQQILNEEALFGYWLNVRWLQKQSEQVKEEANQLHFTLQQIFEIDEDQKNT